MDFKALNKRIPFQWRVQAFYPKNSPTNCQCVAYIDARDVMALLDDVVGPGNWMSDYKEIKGRMYGGVGIKCGEVPEWVWKWDCGTESETEGEKGEASDAFKRAAVKWGIGRFLYDMGLQKVGARSENGGKPFPVDPQGNRIWDLTKYINDMNKTPAQKLGMFAHGITMGEREAQEAAAAAAKTAPAPVEPNIPPVLKADYRPVKIPDPPSGPQVTGCVKGVFAKSGPKKDGSSYTRFSITMDNGEALTTFSESFAAIANKSLEHGLEVVVTYKLNGKWKDVTDLRLTDADAGQALEDSFMRNIEEPPERVSRWG
jgi:hypothetical protein